MAVVTSIEGKIADIGQGMVVPKGAVDCKGDYISAGLVELHTDNLERHMQPRPGVKWPMKAAILSHDAELASVGITTVFDALRVGSITSDKKSKYEKYARVVATDIVNMHAKDQLRVSHFIHLRAEVCTETLLEEMGEFTTDDRIGIVSIMDHTPGQRQFRDLSKMEEYLVGKYSMSKQDVLEHFDKLYSLRDQYGVAHEAGAARIGKELGAVLASHDDTTLKDVETSAQKGVRIAEFPTTLEAGQECHNRNIGESGSGKSTLLNCLASHLEPDTGEVCFDTRADGLRDTVTMSEPERRMLSRTDWAFVHQHARDGLRMGVSAGGNAGERLMGVGARHYGDIREQAVDWLERVEINEDRIDDRPTAFSGGMQQRLQIARNLITGPRLVFMDEPTGGLDVSVQARLLDLLKELVREGKRLAGKAAMKWEIMCLRRCQWPS